jgi:hypothetical protein
MVVPMAEISLSRSPELARSRGQVSVIVDEIRYGFELRSAFPDATSTGNERCSCTIVHFPLIFL